VGWFGYGNNDRRILIKGFDVSEVAIFISWNRGPRPCFPTVRTFSNGSLIAADPDDLVINNT
jgi:hypothetical protein